MIEERIQKTESAVKSAADISADKKAELLGLLAKLKPALGKVSQTHHEDAQSIARFAEASAREATRKRKSQNCSRQRYRAYFQSVRGTIAEESGNTGALDFKIGVYGSGKVCRLIKEESSLADYSWLAESPGWSDYAEYKNRCDVLQAVHPNKLQIMNKMCKQ